MSEVTLRVSPEVMIKQADAIKNTVNKIGRQFDNIGERVGKIQTYWEGKASDCHCAKYKEIYKQVEEVVKRIGGHPDDLLRMAGIYQTTETEDVDNIVSLPQDIIL